MFRKMYKETMDEILPIVQLKSSAVPALMSVNTDVLTVSIGPWVKLAPVEVQKPQKTGEGPVRALAIALVAMIDCGGGWKRRFIARLNTPHFMPSFFAGLR